MALSKFLDPRNDLCFKKIFGTEKNKNILIHFLNDILGFTEINAIQEVEFLSTINPSYGLADKERHRNRGLFRLHGVGNQNRKNMN